MTPSPFVYLMGLLYIIAGFAHFWKPKFYVKMIEAFLPCPLAVVYVSGALEVFLGLGILFEITRSIAAIGIILLLIAVFPANIYMALTPKKWHIAPIWLYLRLPLQFILIYWAYLYT